MGLLIFAYRKQDIIRRRLDIELKITQLTSKLRDLQSYSSSIADGSVTMNEMMTAPPSMFNRMSIFLMNSNQAAMMGANTKMAGIMAMPGAMPQMPDPMAMQQYQQAVFNNLYEQEREKFKKIEEKLLNEQEKKIQSDMDKLQTQLKMLEAESQSVTQAEDKAAKETAPKFGFGGG